MNGISLATKGLISSAIDSTSSGDIVPLSGQIQIEPEVWQLITIPVRYGYFDSGTGSIISDGTTSSTIKNYFLDQISYLIGEDASTAIEIVNTYRGDDNSFKSFIPGVTNPESSNNFSLVFNDSGRLEYTAFWVKSIYPENIVISWIQSNNG